MRVGCIVGRVAPNQDCLTSAGTGHAVVPKPPMRIVRPLPSALEHVGAVAAHQDGWAALRWYSQGVVPREPPKKLGTARSGGDRGRAAAEGRCVDHARCGVVRRQRAERDAQSIMFMVPAVSELLVSVVSVLDEAASPRDGGSGLGGVVRTGRRLAVEKLWCDTIGISGRCGWNSLAPNHEKVSRCQNSVTG